MASNSVGKEFVMTCFGESHGEGIGVVVDGCPAGLQLSEEDIQKELDRRIPSNPSIVSKRREKDRVQIISGIFNDYTSGAPISMLVRNEDVISSDYEPIKDRPRPGHADYPARMKYGNFNDYRGGGRFSGRITIALIMAGAIAKKLLGFFGIEIFAYTVEIGKVKMEEDATLDQIRRFTYETPVRCPHLGSSHKMMDTILRAKQENDSLGGIVECIALNAPVGIGDPIFDSLDGEIAKLLFAVPAVKGVEFGAGFSSTRLKGSENNDMYIIREGKVSTTSNNAGGILGGLSSGLPIQVRVGIKPTPSISKEQKTVDLSRMEETSIAIKGRHDPCIVPKAVPVIESAVAIVIADHMLRARFIPKIFSRRA